MSHDLCVTLIYLQTVLSLEAAHLNDVEQLVAKNEEIAKLRFKLSMMQKEEEEEEDEVFVSCQGSMDTKVEEKQLNELRSLQAETVEVNNKVMTLSVRCEDLKKRVTGEQVHGRSSECLHFCFGDTGWQHSL